MCTSAQLAGIPTVHTVLTCLHWDCMCMGQPMPIYAQVILTPQTTIVHLCPQVIPTPLTRLRWWRVCLDEAQMVESTTAKAAEMALKLQTVHRW